MGVEPNRSALGSSSVWAMEQELIRETHDPIAGAVDLQLSSKFLNRKSKRGGRHIARDLAERREDETSLVKARMGNRQAFVVERELAI